jgi:hypothetical protein
VCKIISEVGKNMEEKNTRAQEEEEEEVKGPRAESFTIFETEKYNVYYRFKYVPLLKMAEAVEQYRPSTLADLLSLAYDRVMDRVVYDREFNKAVSQALKNYYINWEKIRKKIHTYYEAHGNDWVLFCYRNKRVCIELAVLEQMGQANNIVVNVYYY